MFDGNSETTTVFEGTQLTIDFHHDAWEDGMATSNNDAQTIADGFDFVFPENLTANQIQISGSNDNAQTFTPLYGDTANVTVGDGSPTDTAPFGFSSGPFDTERRQIRFENNINYDFYRIRFFNFASSRIGITEIDFRSGSFYMNIKPSTMRKSGAPEYDFSADPLRLVTSSLSPLQAIHDTQLGLAVTGSILPGVNNAFDLGSPDMAWRDLFLSENSLRFVSQSGEITRVSQDDAKQVFEGRKSSAGMPMKRLRGFSSASTFIDLEATNKAVGDRIDVKVANTFEALSISTARVSLGPKETVPLELTGSLKVRPSHANPHELKGKYEFKGNPDNFGTAGSGVVIQDAAFFDDKGGVVPQPGVISQSLNIGTATSPSINIMDGVEDSCFIKIADGITVRVNDGSLFKIQCPQSDVTVDTNNDTITISNGGGDETIISTGQFGTNPQYISNHTVVPSGQVAIWYGPIYIGRFTLNPFGSDFDPDGAGVLNMDLAGQGDNASLRIHNGSQIKVQAF